MHRTGIRFALAFALLSAGLAVPSCDRDAADEPAAESSAAEPAPAAEPELTPDEKLAEEVRQAMLQAPALLNENIDIAVVQQQVFLAGEVSAPHLRDEAVAVAGSVPGVVSVTSKIHVRR